MEVMLVQLYQLRQQLLMFQVLEELKRILQLLSMG